MKHKNNSSETIHDQLEMKTIHELTWSLTHAAVHRVDAGLGLQAAGRWFSQVATESGVAGLPGQPLKAGVGERGHVLPAPVGHVDLPESHPGRHRGLVLSNQKDNQVTRKTFPSSSVTLISPGNRRRRTFLCDGSQPAGDFHSKTVVRQTGALFPF